MELFSKDLILYNLCRKKGGLLQLLCHGLDHQRHHEDHFRLKQLDILRHTHERIIDADHSSQRYPFQNVHTQTVCMMNRKHRHNNDPLRDLHV